MLARSLTYEEIPNWSRWVQFGQNLDVAASLLDLRQTTQMGFSGPTPRKRLTVWGLAPDQKIMSINTLFIDICENLSFNV